MNFITENKAETNRLRTLKDWLARHWETELGGGWTVGTMLCHLAFWDKMTQVRIKVWFESGKLAPLPDADNVFAINDSVRAMSEEITAEEGLKFVIHCADELDQLVASLEPNRLKELEASGRERWFKRHLHRKAHLDRIEAGVRERV
jgi:hypothetical protein